jgi:hypothetical protein
LRSSGDAAGAGAAVTSVVSAHGIVDRFIAVAVTDDERVATVKQITTV